MCVCAASQQQGESGDLQHVCVCCFPTKSESGDLQRVCVCVCVGKGL